MRVLAWLHRVLCELESDLSEEQRQHRFCGQHHAGHEHQLVKQPMHGVWNGIVLQRSGLERDIEFECDVHRNGSTVNVSICFV